MITGWYDIFLRGCLRSFTALSAADGAAGKHRLVVGPWAHGRLNTGVFGERSFGARSSSDSLNLTGQQLDFFDRWLKPNRTPASPAVDDEPVALFVVGENIWRQEPAWPLARTEARSLHLAELTTSVGGRPLRTLTEAAGAAEWSLNLRFDHSHPFPTIGGPNFLPGLDVGVNTGPRDQGQVLGRDDCLCFVGAVLERALEVTGDILVELFVKDAAPGLLFVARLLDVWPHGSRFEVVTEGGRRLRVGQAQVDAVKIDVGATGYVFAPGHRIGLLLANGSYPRYQRHVNGTPERGSVEILSGPQHPSRLILPMVPHGAQR
jgi:putative CocE/NonD family hydrolase